MLTLSEKNQTILLRTAFFSLLFLSVLHIYSCFPNQEEYRMHNDEGNYYRQAVLVSQQGLAGYKVIMQNYLGHPEAYETPPPVRILHIQFAAMAISIVTDMRALSALSLFWFTVLCLVSWYYLNKLWGEKTAFTACAILAFSPLVNGMATRALMDSEVCFFSTLSLYLLIVYCRSGGKKDGLLLSFSLAACLLVKESFLVLYPFFPVMMFCFYRKEKKIKMSHILVFSLLPVVVCLGAYTIAFGGLQTVTEVYQILSQVSVLHPVPYDVTFGSGPWYQYLTDLLILSPAVSLLFFLFVGYFILAGDRKDQGTIILLLYVIWFIFFHSFLHKNVRYAISLEPIYVLFAAMALLKIQQIISWRKQGYLSLMMLLALVIILQVRSFNHFFRDGRLYDPVSYNLLKTEKIIP